MTDKGKMSKTTFRVDPKVLRRFQTCIDTLRLRRDRYLDDALPIAIGMLKGAKANSPTAATLMRSVQEAKTDNFQKVAIRLSQSTIENMNLVCADKGIPRNQFFQSFLEHLVFGPENGMGPAPLAAACELIEDPWSNWAGTEKDETPFDHIIMEDLTDADIMKYVHERRTNQTGTEQ